ncbi:uncharacterized protein LOC131183798 isoform X2 [Hevea brasiliensis]|uniref:uncharacterized protein LOC131183798 isoform X2 n=1 Tax=Hevea brasiliensis TaxID=3981 RepID=UPI0025ED622D|nr:uncharacterized protein LOC131183798 isoform X2 [Hevea brasiliensis]XP_058010388.1 uncharacterized protein LOC131183798 isoform X2 [Hevea brasiliensis]
MRILLRDLQRILILGTLFWKHQLIRKGCCVFFQPVLRAYAVYCDGALCIWILFRMHGHPATIRLSLTQILQVLQILSLPRLYENDIQAYN